MAIKHRCKVCGYIYEDDPKNAGIPFEEQDESYLCVVCGVPKSEFEEIRTRD